MLRNLPGGHTNLNFCYNSANGLEPGFSGFGLVPDVRHNSILFFLVQDPPSCGLWLCLSYWPWQGSTTWWLRHRLGGMFTLWGCWPPPPGVSRPFLLMIRLPVSHPSLWQWTLRLCYHLQSSTDPTGFSAFWLGNHLHQIVFSLVILLFRGMYFPGDGDALPTTNNTFSPKPRSSIVFLIPPLNLYGGSQYGIYSPCSKRSVAPQTT